MTTRWLVALTAVALILGCRGGNSQQDDLGSLVEQCKAGAAKTANVNEADVHVTRVEAVVWRDGSLGYPEPGMDYIQMLVPGYRITLQAGGKTYEYHTDKGKRVVWRAEGAQPPAQVIGPVEFPGTAAPSSEAWPGVLYLEPVPNEPNLNCKLNLLARNGQKQTVVEACSAFAVSRDGAILAKARTSRSGHDLLITRVGETPRVVAKAFDFEAMAFSQTDARYAVLVRGTVGQSWVLHIGTPEDEAPKPLDWAPTVQRGNLARVSLAGDMLLLTEADSDDEPPRVTVLDLYGQKVIATLRAPAAELTVFPAAHRPDGP